MFKIQRTKAIPEGTETRTYRGERQARIRVDGKMAWVKLNDNGRAVIESPSWYANVGGRRVKLARDKSTAEIKLNGMRLHQEKVEAGLALPMAEASGAVEDLVKEYVQALKMADRRPSTYERLPSLLGRMLPQLGIKTLKDLRRLSREDLDAWVAKARGKPYTVVYHLQRLHSFLKWLQEKRKLGVIPPFPQVKGRVTRPKAVLTPEVEAALLAASPANRATMYRLMLSTGCRTGAATALRVSDLHLDRSQGPTMSLRAEHAKTKRGLLVPIPIGLVPELRSLVEGKSPNDQVFGIKSTNNATLAFRRDLARAKIPARQPDGWICLHALRHTFATRALRAGVSPAIVARVGGWSSLTVLMQSYSHLIADDGADLVNALFKSEQQQSQ